MLQLRAAEEGRQGQDRARAGGRDGAGCPRAAGPWGAPPAGTALGCSEQGRGHSEQGGIIPWLTNTRTGGGRG